MKILEIPNRGWSLRHMMKWRVGRTQKTVQEYLADHGHTWTESESPLDCDVKVRKVSAEGLNPKTIPGHINHRLKKNQQEVVLIGEPVELSRYAHIFGSPRTTLTVAPGGSNFERMVYPGEWEDPRLEDWNLRQDAVVWFARPYPWRVAQAKKWLDIGVPLHIYNRQDWGLPCWRGPAANELEVSRRYRYRIAAENYSTHLCHTEKLWNSVRAGCVTFYESDPGLDISGTQGLSIQLKDDFLMNRSEFVRSIHEKMNQFMFSDEWRVYAPEVFYETVLNKARKVLGEA